MRRILTISALSLLTIPLLAACAFVPIGPLVTQDRPIEDVTAVSLDSMGDLTITRGEPSLTITAGSGVIDSLTAEVRDGVLHLGSKRGFGAFRGDVRYELSLPTLESLTVAGSGDVTADFGGAATVLVAIEGSGDIEGSGIGSDSVRASIEGSGDLELSGDTDRLDVSIEGSGDIDLDDLTARDASASIDGSGDIRVRATSTLEASISGSGTIRYSGGAEVSSSIDGSGAIVEDD